MRLAGAPQRLAGANRILTKYGGKTYYFCSSSCKKTFAQMPKKYLPQKQVYNKYAPIEKKRKRGCCG
jgi:ribosomal protein L24E